MKTCFLIAILNIPIFLWAEDNIIDERYFRIADTQVEILEISEDNTVPIKLEERVNPIDKAAPVAAGAIINTGATAWNIINNSQANANLNYYYASAMPNPLTWSEVVGWKGPKKIVYSLKFKNLLGMTVLDIRYIVTYYYGGNVKGKGHYIANFTIKPIDFYIRWGFKFDMSIQISNPMNVGTAEDPMAYLQADLKIHFSSPIQKYNEFNTYAVRGDGDFRDITEKLKTLRKDLDISLQQQEIKINW